MIVQKLLTKNRFSRPGKSLNKLLGVVVHYVGVNNQKPEQTVSYFESLKEGKNSVYASAHYIIGTDGDGINCIPDTEVAYHCGARSYKPGITERLSDYPNYTTIGIELCHTEDGFTQKTLETASQLIAQILIENDLNLNDVYRHFDITGKLCPKFMVENEDEWKYFRSLIQEKIV